MLTTLLLCVRVRETRDLRAFSWDIRCRTLMLPFLVRLSDPHLASTFHDTLKHGSAYSSNPRQNRSHTSRSPWQFLSASMSLSAGPIPSLPSRPLRHRLASRLSETCCIRCLAQRRFFEDLAPSTQVPPSRGTNSDFFLRNPEILRDEPSCERADPSPPALALSLTR